MRIVSVFNLYSRQNLESPEGFETVCDDSVAARVGFKQGLWVISGEWSSVESRRDAASNMAENGVKSVYAFGAVQG
ncbi:hypothetical protein V6N11_059871 [Hibiscus sabdariffa]|uniref:Uncharacterized protein n=2 Tax=Hibiscus sabdariffa TaxID=183260 RepID=A0ABR2NYD7_9ROSI